MTRALALLFAALALLLPGTGAIAQSGARVVASTSWVEEWDPVSARWVRVDDHTDTLTTPAVYEPAVTTTVTRADGVTITESVFTEPSRFIAGAARPVSRMQAGIAQFGPFRVLDEARAALVATTDAASPQAFAAMLAAFPGLSVIEFADAPGTNHDLANLKLGRAIRAAGLATHVPEGGSARSGAVELFLAGTRRTMDPGALFAVHSWRDERGREPDDFAADAPENRLYLDYYAEMGMSAAEARDFYAMTNSVPHAGALWLKGTDMAQWIAPLDAAPRVRDARVPAARAFAPVIAAMVLADEPMLRHWAVHRPVATAASATARPAFASAPQLAYADLRLPMLALLDSGLAFP